jgi:mono/diheme cytochrome c family protein
MAHLLRWGVTGLAALAGLALAAAGLAWLASESVIERHYPLLSMDVPVSDKADIVARGARLAKLTGCVGCHGDGLRGRRLAPVDHFRIAAPNLTRSAQGMSDEELARAIRDGLKPDGTSLWVMPSEDYTFMSVADVAAMISYIHSLKPVGVQFAAARFKRRDRFAILAGTLEPSTLRVQDGGASLNLGPRYEGGRYIARISCAACHGLDLSGTPGHAPDLDAVGRYSLRDFFVLLREGHTPDYRPVPAMKALARPRFGNFRDYEVMALYDYLAARAAALPPK